VKSRLAPEANPNDAFVPQLNTVPITGGCIFLRRASHIQKAGIIPIEIRDAEWYLALMNQKNSSPGEFPSLCPLVTPNMVRCRTVELAVSAGRSPIEIRQSDYEQAKRELTGETDFERQHTVLYGG